MRGYVPPFQHPLMTQQFVGNWPDEMSLGRWRISRKVRPTSDDVAWFQPAASALAVLIRDHLDVRGSKDASDVDAATISVAAVQGLGSKQEHWPLSLTTAALGFLKCMIENPLPDAPWFEPFVRCFKADGVTEFNEIALLMLRNVTKHRLSIKHALSHGYYVAAGIGTSDTWIDVADVATGEVRFPEFGATATDGDCVVLDGWDDEDSVFSCWFMGGTEWGVNGKGVIPYRYVESCTWCHELVMIPR